MDTATWSLLRTEIYNRTNHIWAYLQSSLVGEKELPASTVSCEQSHNLVPERSGDVVLGWQVTVLSHFSHTSALTWRFSDTSKAKCKTNEKCFLLPPIGICMFILWLEKVLPESKHQLWGPTAAFGVETSLLVSPGHMRPHRPTLHMQLSAPEMETYSRCPLGKHLHCLCCSIKTSVFKVNTKTPSNCPRQAASAYRSNSFLQSKLFLKDGSVWILFKAIKLKVAILYQADKSCWV